MHYYLSINGKIVSKPMTKEQAEIVLCKLSGTINGLEIMEADVFVVDIKKLKGKKLVKRKINFDDKR